MSGVMIKTGIYGLLRALTFLGPPPAWWGWPLVGVGRASPACSACCSPWRSTTSSGCWPTTASRTSASSRSGSASGCSGCSYGCPPLAVLGFAGALLHVLNHALFKGLLFLGAGRGAARAPARARSTAWAGC